jgi:hypothetical protein
MDTECIYSLQNPEKCKRNADSKEDFLPRALGKFEDGSTLNEKLCTECNNKLGKLDEILMRSHPVAILRETHGVKGRKNHRKINPFYERSHGHPPLALYGQAKGDVPFRIEPTENHRARPLRALNIGDEEIPIPDQMIGSPDSLKDFVRSKAEGTPGAQPRITYPENDSEFHEVLKKSYGKNIEFISTKPDHSTGEYPIDAIAQSQTSQEVLRAIAKIGFHFFLWAFQETFSGHESYFDGIKQYIWGKTDFHEIVTLQPSPSIILLEPALQNYQPSYIHVLTAGFDEIGGMLVSSVTLFSDSTSGIQYHLTTDHGLTVTCPSIEWRVRIGESSLIIPITMKRYGFVGNSNPKQNIAGKMVRL